jgi:hypothetical protein
LRSVTAAGGVQPAGTDGHVVDERAVAFVETTYRDRVVGTDGLAPARAVKPGPGQPAP